MNPKPDTAVIENITPLFNGGRYPAKRAEGEDLVVEADIFKDGHDKVRALLKWRPVGADTWNRTAMTPLANDRWRGVFPVGAPGIHEYTIEAWGDLFESWRDEYRKKFDGGNRDLESERLEGAGLVQAAAVRAGSGARKRRGGKSSSAPPVGNAANAKVLRAFAAKLRKANDEKARALADDPELGALMNLWADRSFSTQVRPFLTVRSDRKRAVFAAWYEFFPRSAEGKPDAGSTFRDCIGRVEDAAAMGFDVIYFPPIHPIGETNRKGRNNSVTCKPGDPGVPYAIGNHRQGVNGGGHKDVAPELGTLEDFRWLVAEIHKRGLEVALDFAINCSPDHPYVRDHPEWFFKRPDGTIKYAENPPKKYEDVYPLNFHNADWRSLWQEMRDVVLFWCGQGVRIFRVDNPHTKPVAFWEWLIIEVQEKFPDSIFLSEAFTRPKMMKALAKAGFTQSYTYFTWRNTKPEIEEYFTELNSTEMNDYFRGNLFTNTPDILPFFLQQGGRPAFLIRAVLAATLSPLYGIYSGFELCENEALPGREEYADSEKYHFQGRDWDRPGNIKEFITRLNTIRRQHRALQLHGNLAFHGAANDQIVFYSRMTPAKDDILLVLVSLDPFQPQTAWVDVPVERFGFMESDTYQVEDLLGGEIFTWSGCRNYIALDPHSRPAHILRLRRVA